MQILID